MAQHQWAWNTNNPNEPLDYYEEKQRGKAWDTRNHPSFDRFHTYQGDHQHAYSPPEYQFGYGTGYPNQDRQNSYDGYSTQEYNEGYGGYLSPKHQYGYGPEYPSWNIAPQRDTTHSSHYSDQEEVYNMLKVLLQNQKASEIRLEKEMADTITYLDESYNDLNNNFEMPNAYLEYLDSQQPYTHIPEDSDVHAWGDFIQNKVQAEPPVAEMDQLADEILEELAEEENDEAGYLHGETQGYEMLLDSHITVDELGGFADLSKSITVLTAAIVEESVPTRHEHSTLTSSQARNSTTQPTTDSTTTSSQDVESCIPGDTNSVISFGDSWEREEEEPNPIKSWYKEENSQESESWCNEINEDEPECYNEPYGPFNASGMRETDTKISYKRECKEDDFSLEAAPEMDKEGEQKYDEIYMEFEKLMSCTIDEDLVIRYEEEEQCAEELDMEFKKLMSCTIDEDLVIRYEEEEQSAEELDMEFEKLMSCNIDEDLVISYEEEKSPLTQHLHTHTGIISTTSPSYHGPEKTNFKRIRLTNFRGWPYNAPRRIPFEEIRMNTFRGRFYDEYDPGDPSYSLNYT